MNNTLVSWLEAPKFHYVWSLPYQQAQFNVSGNHYYTPNSPSLAFGVAGPGSMNPPGTPRPKFM